MSNNKTLVFTTEIFPLSPNGDGGCCGPVPGLPLAAWLHNELSGKGYHCAEPEQKEYAWGFWAKRNELQIWITLNYAAGDNEDGSDTEWMLNTTYESPFSLLKPNLWFSAKDGYELAEKIF